MPESRSWCSCKVDDLGLHHIWRCGYFDSNINAQKYIEVVDNFVLPVIARHFPDDNYVFQDDNAPMHRARVVKEYMEETD